MDLLSVHSYLKPVLDAVLEWLGFICLNYVAVFVENECVVGVEENVGKMENLSYKIWDSFLVYY